MNQAAAEPKIVRISQLLTLVGVAAFVAALATGQAQRAWEASLDGLISRLVVSAVEAERKASFDRAQEIWATEMPAIPTIAPDILVGWSRRLENVRPSVLVPHLVWNAEAISVRRR